jgi:hypothetical protein
MDWPILELVTMVLAVLLSTYATGIGARLCRVVHRVSAGSIAGRSDDTARLMERLHGFRVEPEEMWGHMVGFLGAVASLPALVWIVPGFWAALGDEHPLGTAHRCCLALTALLGTCGAAASVGRDRRLSRWWQKLPVLFISWALSCILILGAAHDRALAYPPVSVTTLLASGDGAQGRAHWPARVEVSAGNVRTHTSAASQRSSTPPGRSRSATR